MKDIYFTFYKPKSYRWEFTLFPTIIFDKDYDHTYAITIAFMFWSILIEYRR